MNLNIMKVEIDTYVLYHTKFFIDSDEITKMRNTVHLTYQAGKRIQ